MLANILLTGSSGFLGRQIFHSLKGENEIDTLSRNSGTFKIDLSIQTPSFKAPYKIVIHAAGKAHSIPTNEHEEKEFYDSNVEGTKNLLLALDKSGRPESIVFISSVAVYGLDKGLLITEDYPLCAIDPYGKSKIIAEKLVSDWAEKNNVICSVLRLPLIAGSHPPGNLKAMIHGIKHGYYFDIDKGKAKKSIVLSSDIAKIIPLAAKRGGIYNLTDGYHPCFSELSDLIAKQLGKGKPRSLPMWLANVLAKTGDSLGSRFPLDSSKLSKLTTNLTFDDSKAIEALGWNPTAVLEGFTIF